MAISATRFYKILGKAHFKKAAQREDGLITYEPSSDVIVSQQRTTEREAFEVASGKTSSEPTPPPSKDRYDYTVGKSCSKCKRYRKFMYYGTKRIRGVVYMQSWCNMCMAEWAQEQYRKSSMILRG